MALASARRFFLTCVPPMPQLVVLLDGVELQRRTLPPGRTRLGRRTGNEIVIDDPTVSGEHAVLTVENGQLWLEDLHSSNGSYINGRAVRRERIEAADQVELGRVRLRFEALPGETGAGPAPAGRAWLQVTRGPAAGRRLPLDKPRVSIGHPGLGSAVLELDAEGGHCLRALGGARPSLNGQPLGETPPRLRHGDEIELAGSGLRYERGA